MATYSPFRRQRCMWFECAHCDRRSYNSLVGARYSVSPNTYLVLFKCPTCKQFSRLRHSTLHFFGALLSSGALFLLAYRSLLAVPNNFLLQAAVLLVAIALAMAAQVLISRLTYRYVAYRDAEAL